MKKIGKLLLIGISALSLFILGIVLLFNVSSYLKREKVKKDQIEYSKICDSTKIISEQPEIGFAGFNEKDINVLKFEIKRGKNIFSDTILKNKFNYISDDKTYRKISIPFSEFLKTDTIIITTRNNLKFYISDFHHGASLHYGCGLNENFNINGKYCNCISKDIASLESERHNRIKIVGAIMDEEIEIISKKSKITNKMAEKIFNNNRMNKHWLSQIFCGIHIEKTGNYYVFEEEREDRNGKEDIIKINAENGNYKRYSNYPFN